MSTFKLTVTSTFALLILFTFNQKLLAHEADASHESVTPAFKHVIPNSPGKTITSLVVDYGPGVKSKPHRHGSAFVIAYVLSGSIKSQVEGEAAKVYKAGESWTEAPGAHHVISENVSDTEPAKLLAIFIADSKEKSLVTYDKDKR